MPSPDGIAFVISKDERVGYPSPQFKMDQTSGAPEPALLHLQTIQHSLVCGPQLTKVSVWGDEDQVK